METYSNFKFEISSKLTKLIHNEKTYYGIPVCNLVTYETKNEWDYYGTDSGVCEDFPWILAISKSLKRVKFLNLSEESYDAYGGFTDWYFNLVSKTLVLDITLEEIDKLDKQIGLASE